MTVLINSYVFGLLFPQVAAVADSETAVADSSHTVDLPAGIESGNLLIAFTRSNGNDSSSWPAGWTELWDQIGANAGFSGAYRIADGSEGASITLTTSGNTIAVHAALRITGAHASAAPEDGTPPAVVESENADPPSVTPSWGAANTLWIAIGSNFSDENPAPVVYPANYDENQTEIVHSVTPQLSLAYATRELNATSEDPAAFFFDENDASFVQAQTIAVRPAA